MLKDVTAVVLAGGNSVRFGRDKAFESLPGMSNQSLIQVIVDRLSPIMAEALVVTSKRLLPQLELLGLKARLVTDIHQGCGPLGGIHTGLATMQTEYAFAVGCDMPFLNLALIDYMAGLRPQCDVVMPRIGDFREPLHAVYSRACLAVAERRLEEGDISAYGMLDELIVCYVEAEEVDRFDPGRRSFFNINRMTDMQLARELAQE